MSDTHAKPATHPPVLDAAKEVIDIEIQGLVAMKHHLDDAFEHACALLLNCRGRIVVTGMGKSGHIANKIAATLASTGTPAFFVHPAEANHGDIGMIMPQDIVLALSFSGETKEVLSLLPLIKSLNIPLISITGRPQSSLSHAANINLNAAIPKEACPLGLAPTASTTNCLVLGDAIAICLLKQRKFTSEDFARAHPGGNLGKKLLLKVEDMMHTGDAMPQVSPHCTLTQTLLEITEKRLGMTCIVDQKTGQILGVFTDGDLRRAVDHGIDLHATQVMEVMSTAAITAAGNTLVHDAIKIMQKNRITTLVITDIDGIIVGITHLHDLLQTGMDPSA
jgi:arabinose-5-phosphate isomerase